MDPVPFTDRSVSEALDILHALTDPGVSPDQFRASKPGIVGPDGLFNKVYQHFVDGMDVSPDRVVGQILGRLGLTHGDDGVLEYRVPGDDGVVFRGDDAVDIAWRRQMRVVLVLQVLLHVNRIIQYDGTFKGGCTEMAERWQQIVGSMVHMYKITQQFSAMQVFHDRKLLAMASNSGKCTTFDLLRLELVDPSKLSRFQRLLVNLLRDAKKEFGGLRKYDGKLFRAKRVPELCRRRDEMGRVVCSGAPGCHSGLHSSDINCRANHIFKPVLELKDPGARKLYSTHAYVPIHVCDEYDVTQSRYRSNEIQHFIQVMCDKVHAPTAWLDLTASTQSLKNITEYLTNCIDDELPSLDEDQDIFMVSFINGAYQMKQDRFYPYWCSRDPDDPEACVTCRTSGSPCLSDVLAANPAAASKYIDTWIDFAEIDQAVLGQPLAGSSALHRPERYRFRHFEHNAVCERCHKPSNRHRVTECERITSDIPATMLPRCAECGVFGVPGHWGAVHSRPPPPCACWAPYRLRSDVWRHIPTPYMDSILDYQSFSEDSTEQQHVHMWIYALLGRLKHPNNSMDRWQVAMMIVGAAATGKSTIADFVQGMFNPEDVGIMQSRSERDFGTSALVTNKGGGQYDFKPLIVAPEMSADERGMDQAMWQSIVTGERVTVAIKNMTAPCVRPRSQILMCGNEIIRFKENAGQFSRRIIQVVFTREVQAQHKDGLLGRRLLEEELPAFIVKANRAYHALFEASGGASGEIWGTNPFDKHRGCPVGNPKYNLPKYFHDAKKNLSRETNVMKKFFNEKAPDLIFDPTVYIRETELKDMFQEYCKSINYRPVPVWEKSMYENALRERNIVVEQGSREWEPGSGNQVHDTYYIGLSVSTDKGGWFSRPEATSAEAAEAVVAPDRWESLLRYLRVETTSPVPDHVFCDVMDTHLRRHGKVSSRLAGYFHSRFQKGDQDMGRNLLAEFAEFQAWKKEKNMNPPSTTLGKRIRVGSR